MGLVQKQSRPRPRNKKIMADPAMKAIMPKKNPFDWKRMVYGGFKVGVDA